jgi:hypothetical protein
MSAVLPTRFPTLCIPCTPISDPNEIIRIIKSIFFGNVKVEGGIVEGKKYYAWFVTFPPTEETNYSPELLTAFDKLENGHPVKMWISDKKFWHLTLSKVPHHLKHKVTVGPEYAEWDRESDYDEFLAKRTVEPEIEFGW